MSANNQSLLSQMVGYGIYLSMTTGLEGSAPLPVRIRATGRQIEDAGAVELREVFARCELRLGRYLAQMVKDRGTAEDLLQDTFHDAFKARDRLRKVENPEAWLFGIAHNRALNSLRKRRRFLTAVSRLTALARTSTEQDHEVVALRDLLERHLTPEDRALLLLHHLHGFSTAELATISARSPEAVRQRLSRARTKVVAATSIEAREEANAGG